MIADLPVIASGSFACVDDHVIDARNVSVIYGGRAILSDVTLAIRRNFITSVIGPSGCGKTSFLTALNRMSDLVPGCTIGGCIEVMGRDICGPSQNLQQLRCNVGMIFQRANPFPLSIRRNIDMPLREHGVTDRHERETRVERVLTDVGLWTEVRDRLDTPALALSGGQQQRLCIARALALEPTILLMDEPCSALDPISSAVVEDLIVTLKGRYTVIIVTHNLAQARRISDDVALFWAVDGVGRLIEHGATSAVFDHPQTAIAKAYISGTRG